MKNRTDKILLAVFLLSLAVYVIDIIFGKGGFWEVCLVLSLHGVPVFCLQMLLCRKVRRWGAAIPTVILLGAALFFAYGSLTTTGWDSLGYAIFLAFSVAPAVGSTLAWAVFGCWRLYKRRKAL